MKKIDLSEVFQMLDDENLEMPIDEQQKSDINPEKILKMTMERVHQEEKKQKTIYFMKNLKRFAACVAVAAILGTGVFVAANEENITRNIEGILGLPEEKVEKQEKTIEGKHFKVTVADSAFDGNIGWLSFRVHGISEEGKKSIANPGLHTFDRLFQEDISLTAPGMYGILRKREGYTQYFVLNFSNTVQEGDVVRFTAADQNLDIPLKKTYETKEIDIRSLSDDLRKYETMEYSALGVKVTGEELKNSYQPSEELYFKFKVRYKSGEEERLELDGALQQKGGNTEFGAVYQFRKEFDWSEVEAVSVNDIWFEL